MKLISFSPRSRYGLYFKKSFFGSHYNKLRSIKDKYDPTSLFIVHSGGLAVVVVERWTMDDGKIALRDLPCRCMRNLNQTEWGTRILLIARRVFNIRADWGKDKDIPQKHCHNRWRLCQAEAAEWDFHSGSHLELRRDPTAASSRRLNCSRLEIVQSQ